MLFMPQGEQEKKVTQQQQKKCEASDRQEYVFHSCNSGGCMCVGVCMCRCGRLTARLQMSMRSTEICKLR